MRKKHKRICAVVLAMIMIFSSIATAYAATGTVVDRRQITVKAGSTTWSFVVNDGRGNMNGTCMDPHNQSIPAKNQYADFVRLSSSDRLCKLAYLAVNEFSTDVQQYAVGRAAAYLAGKIPYNNYEYYQTVNSLIERSASVSVPGNFEAYRVKPTNGAQEILAWRLVPNGKVKVKKITANNNNLVAECPENYTLAGAKYGVYASQANASADAGRLLTLTTDAAGNSQEETLRAGTYYVKEVEAPKGYSIDRNIYTVTVTSGQTATVTSADAPRFDPLDIRVTKKPVEGSDKNLKIEGAEYTIKYYKELTDASGNRITTAEQLQNLTPYRTWVIRTDKNGRAALRTEYLIKEKSDTLFLDDDGIPAGLHGTYSIEETLAPTGFAKTDTVWVQQASFDSKLQHIESQLVDITDNEKPQTVSLTINKVDAETGKNEAQGYGSLAGAKYDVFFYDSIKSEDIKVATLTTDERGFARYEGGKPGLYKVVETDASKGYILDKEAHEIKARITEVNTANFDYVVTSKETPITVEIDKTTIDKNGDKITLEGAELQLLDKDKKVIETFTSDKTAHVIKGLTPGKYYIRETKTPEGYLQPEKDIEFTVKETGEVQKVEVFNEPIPEIKTVASFDNGNKNSKPGEKVTVVDAFGYKKVLIGQKYLVKGELVNKATGKVVAKAEKTFTAEKSNGKLDIEFKFAAKDLAGTDLVVTEKLYKVKGDENKLLTVHEDLNDMEQTVCIPSLKTTATDKADGNKNVIASGKQTIVDKVEYTNLYPGKSYTVKGTLMNKNTGKPVLDNGKEVTAEKTFKAESANGFVELEFTFNASALKGETTVVFEDLYENKVIVGTHADIKDKDQTVFVPGIKTTATDKIDSGKDLNGNVKQTIVDKVEYKSLYPGKEYTIKGTLMDKRSGKAILDNGKEVTAEKTFKAEKENGFVELEFTFNASALKGETIVVFEKLYEDGKELAIHTDINDVDQSIFVPRVKTSASFDNGNKNAKPSDKMTVTDVFSFKNLIKGQKYILKGELVDKATGKAITKAEKEFTARSVDGDVKLDFAFDGSKYKDGAELVVTEKLYSLYSGKEKIVASHIDLADLNQTVNIPAIKTTATDKIDNGKDINGNVKQTIVDKVEYKNLYAGKEYTVKGVLMNKATGKPILDDGKEVTAEKTFKAESTNGFVELEFTFNASALKGETIVVFEDIYEGKVIVGTHADINDNDQSVYIPQIHTTATSQDDGTKSVLPVKSVTVSDKIEYKNLIAGQMYQIEGTLVNTLTKEIVAKSSGCFIAEEADGSVTLDFTFDATDLKDKEVVVFEELYKLDENGEKVKKVGEHADITDKGQTVKIENPEIGTTAAFKDGAKKNTAAKDMTVVDRVEYKNLVIGKEYTVKGVLMNKKTGKPFVSADGTEVTAEKKFTAEEANGFVELEFTFNAEGMKNTEVVVFEEMFYKEQQIAAHTDIEDEGQTVKIIKIGTITVDDNDDFGGFGWVKTGDETNILLLVTIFLSAVFLLSIVGYKRKRR